MSMAAMDIGRCAKNCSAASLLPPTLAPFNQLASLSSLGLPVLHLSPPLRTRNSKFARPARHRNSSFPPKSACLCVRSEVRDSQEEEKAPFGYSRKDVLLIGLGVTVLGVGLKYGLEAFGLDSLKAGNVVQLVLVLGLIVGWISTYVFRVANKDMTYAKQLKDYENKVMQKRLEELPEAELEALLAKVEEEKRQLKVSRDNPIN